MWMPSNRIPANKLDPSAQNGPNRRLLNTLEWIASWFSATSTKSTTYSPIFNNRFLRSAWLLYTSFVTPAGRWFVGLTLLLMFIGGASWGDIPAYVPFAYAVGILVVGCLGGVLFRPSLKLSAHMPERVTAGSVMPVWIEVVKVGNVPSVDLIVVPWGFPRSIELVPPFGTVLPTMTNGDKARVELKLRCERRGAFTLRGYKVMTDFPFGLFCSSRSFPIESKLFVLPSYSTLRELKIKSGFRYHPGGVAMASQLGESLDYIGNREYREGDNIRDMDWRATARLNLPILREYREEYYHRVAVILDTQLEFEWMNVSQLQRFERAVSLTAAVSDYMARQEYIVDLFAAGPDVYHLTAGRSLAYTDQILEILACVEPSFEPSFLRLAPEIMQYLAQITTIVCIFMDWTEDRMEFAKKLSYDGAAMKIVIVRDSKPTLNADGGNEFADIRIVESGEFDLGIENL